MDLRVPDFDESIVDPTTGKQTANFNLWLNQLVQQAAAGGSSISSSSFGAASLAAEAKDLASQALLRQAFRGIAPEVYISRPQRPWSVFALVLDTAANLANYPANLYSSALYVETDTYIMRWSDGSAWTERLFPAFLPMLAKTTAQGALKSGASGGVGILMSRLGDDSNYAALWVADEAYSSAWDGQLAVPTKNAVYDKFVSVLALITTATGQYTPLFDHYADVGNVGAGEDDLYSDTLTAGQFAANGDKVIGTYCGIFAGAALSSQRLRFYVAGTLCFDTGALAIGAATTDNWTLQVVIIRVSASILRVAVSAHTDFAALGAPPKYTEVTGLTLANTQVVKITGEATGAGAADSEIVAKMSTLAYSKAA